MERERRIGWNEMAGFAYGQSRRFPAGSWMHTIALHLMAAYAASPVSESLAGRLRQRAAANRSIAATPRRLWPRSRQVARAMRSRAARRPYILRGAPMSRFLSDTVAIIEKTATDARALIAAAGLR